MENIGFQILPLKHRVSQNLIDRFHSIATPLLSDNMNRIQGASADLVPMHSNGRLVGSALTVRTRAGDNLLVHKAIDLALPGDVIVVDAGGDMNQAIIGEIMMRLAQKKGIAGFVIDGAIRDSDAFKRKNYPCFAKGATHRGPYKEGPGEINTAITIGNMVVHPGDIIVGDNDGVVAVPQQYSEKILELALAQEKQEKKTFEQIEKGTFDRSWVDETLRQKGCGSV
ncbi:RraA family protein [Bacillus sp. IITD106]|nr:RraA family protein [Bacillus sp. IITD106]